MCFHYAAAAYLYQIPSQTLSKIKVSCVFNHPDWQLLLAFLITQLEFWTIKSPCHLHPHHLTINLMILIFINCQPSPTNPQRRLTMTTDIVNCHCNCHLSSTVDIILAREKTQAWEFQVKFWHFPFFIISNFYHPCLPCQRNTGGSFQMFLNRRAPAFVDFWKVYNFFASSTYTYLLLS